MAYVCSGTVHDICKKCRMLNYSVLILVKTEILGS